MKISKLSRTVVITALMAGMTSCHIYKKFEMPQDDALTQEYVKASNMEADSTNLGNLAWQQVFTDPALASLIQRALDNNIDLANAKLNVDIAHANLRGARLSYLPSLALGAQGGASSVSNNSLTGWNYTIPLTASWEVDIFGKILNNKRSAEASKRQMEDYAQAVRSQIIGAVANCYYSIATLEAQLRLTQQTAEIWRENVEVMRNYKAAGRTNEAAVVQAQANYLSLLATITDLEDGIHKANNTLALLLGVMPQKFDISADATLTMPVTLSGGVPMVQLARRPDVCAAQEGLAKAYYATNMARAAFYPGLTITANYGFTNMLGSMIHNPGTWFASLAGQLAAPLFARGQNIARLEASKAQQQQALNSFEYTLMSASAEVSNALTAYDKANEKSAFLVEQVDNLEKSVYYTKELFAAAGSTYLEVLTAQSSLLQAQNSELSCRLARAQAVINLYQSLGGGRL